MTVIYIINIATIAVLIGLSAMLIIKGNKRKSALWHYYIPCGSCGRKVHMKFAFLNMAAFWSDIKGICLLDKSHKVTLDRKKYKEIGEIRTSFCWYIFLSLIVFVLVIAFCCSSLMFILQMIAGKSAFLVLILLSVSIFMLSLLYYYYCRSMQTTAFCFNEVGNDHKAEIISLKGKNACVKIGEIMINGTVFSKFRGCEKAGAGKVYVTLPDVTIKESEILQASVDMNEVTKAYTICGVLDAENAVIHSSIDFAVDPYKAENASELNGKYVKIVVPQIGMDIRKL